jgi:hypothetical protein
MSITPSQTYGTVEATFAHPIAICVWLRASKHHRYLEIIYLYGHRPLTRAPNGLRDIDPTGWPLLAMVTLENDRYKIYRLPMEDTTANRGNVERRYPSRLSALDGPRIDHLARLAAGGILKSAFRRARVEFSAIWSA